MSLFISYRTLCALHISIVDSDAHRCKDHHDDDDYHQFYQGISALIFFLSFSEVSEIPYFLRHTLPLLSLCPEQSDDAPILLSQNLLFHVLAPVDLHRYSLFITYGHAAFYCPNSVNHFDSSTAIAILSGVIGSS